MAASSTEASALLDQLRQLIAPKSQKVPDTQIPLTKKPTFASLLSRPNDFSEFSKQLPIPQLRGDTTIVKIEPELHKEQLNHCRTNLIGRIILRPGSKPMKVEELRTILHKVWQPEHQWHMAPLARGFYDIHFSDEVDMRKVWGSVSCSLQHGVFRLYQWQQNFNPYDPKIQSHVQLWIRLRGLSLEYWHPRILMTIARGVGIPLQIDQATREKKYGFYAQILVEVDLSKPLLDIVTVELPDYGFDVKVHYENLPTRCNICNRFGHAEHQCRHGQIQNNHNTQKNSEPKKIYKPVLAKSIEVEKKTSTENNNSLDSENDFLQVDEHGDQKV
ncbi:DUF4283 domain protein [Melia azedarach]|uniref:DUF4283 domain protein n=2 Tax=Melia azedarach TaxID=155640 RepID=A0ACC1XNJ4_MELAZ|nr:DUF4283 domain protein [Melia azedarach]KAJ4712805.1 DUF4283 domain protein [Melia azedarach]